MAHLLDPSRLASEVAYGAALDELEALMLSDPDTPAGRRFDELVALIEDYEARHWPAEVPRMPDARSPAPLYGPL
jgi:antitoxin component HigA of HigAB toxin-antitoxin module